MKNHRLPALVPLILLAGCSRNPNVEIVGSYFPGWMISLTLGIVLTALTRLWLRSRGLLYTVGHPALIYPALTLLFTCVLWLIFFA